MAENLERNLDRAAWWYIILQIFRCLDIDDVVWYTMDLVMQVFNTRYQGMLTGAKKNLIIQHVEVFWLNCTMTAAAAIDPPLKVQQLPVLHWSSPGTHAWPGRDLLWTMHMLVHPQVSNQRSESEDIHLIQLQMHFHGIRDERRWTIEEDGCTEADTRYCLVFGPKINNSLPERTRQETKTLDDLINLPSVRKKQ